MRAVFALIVFAACTTEPIETTDSAESAVVTKKSQTKTVIKQNGLSSDVFLVDPSTGTNGYLNVGRDQISNTTSLDFSYATPTADPNIIILTQGAGQIPNSAYTRTATEAHLLLPATPFPITRCTVNTDDGTSTCVTGGPAIAFDLTWEQNGFSEIEQRIRQRERIGPLTTVFRGHFFQRSATVNGFWNGNTAVDIRGQLLDTQNTTITREIIMEMN